MSTSIRPRSTRSCSSTPRSPTPRSSVSPTRSGAKRCSRSSSSKPASSRRTRSADELLAHCRDRLAHFKCPRAVDVRRRTCRARTTARSTSAGCVRRTGRCGDPKEQCDDEHRASTFDDRPDRGTARLARRQLGPRPVRRRVVGTAGALGMGGASVTGRLLRQRPQPQRRAARRANDRRVRRALGANGHGDRPGVADDRHARHARADRAVHPRCSHRPAELVPAVQRARRRIGSRGPLDPGGPRWRRVGRQRSEGLDVGRSFRRSRHAARPHGSDRARSIRASVGSRSTCTSPASRCVRCAR